ncbi:MAG: hypothetical protein KatS3mg081_0238 [Gemmatimonadales bacterium]|nr:MAG: hypothetical protein KatS3mg081_0238 [Gemmatimonadales bacterium]
MPHLTRLAFLLAACCWLFSETGWAQVADRKPTATIIAIVTDTLDQPVPNAIVEVPGLGISATSDSTGRIVLTRLPPGKYRITVRRLGYRPLEFIHEVGPGERLELSRGTLKLVPAPVVLDPAVVAGERTVRYLEDVGFYERRKARFGDFLTREEFDKYAPSVATDVLRRLTGFVVRPNPNYGGPLYDPKISPEVASFVPDRVDTREWIVESRRKSGLRSSCPPIFFVDGVYVGDGMDADINSLLDVSQLEAVEAYSGAAKIPIMFNRTGSACGMIAFWTKRY